MKNKGTKAIVFITILTLTVVTSFAQSYFTDLSKSKQGIINDPDGYVNIRKEMNTESPVIGIIVENETFNYWEIPNNNWCLVQTSNGTRGYVFSNRIKENNGMSRRSDANINQRKFNYFGEYQIYKLII
ncbi:hypothetical protein FACS189431_6520 [Alphaproteobacteria bacterium]|nr:hypothetical protein FACS189431_6520 [Alphaproteobacteria bacterium]